MKPILKLILAFLIGCLFAMTVDFFAYRYFTNKYYVLKKTTN